MYTLEETLVKLREDKFRDGGCLTHENQLASSSLVNPVATISIHAYFRISSGCA